MRRAPFILLFVTLFSENCLGRKVSVENNSALVIPGQTSQSNTPSLAYLSLSYSTASSHTSTIHNISQSPSSTHYSPLSRPSLLNSSITSSISNTISLKNASSDAPRSSGSHLHNSTRPKDNTESFGAGYDAIHASAPGPWAASSRDRWRSNQTSSSLYPTATRPYNGSLPVRLAGQGFYVTAPASLRGRLRYNKTLTAPYPTGTSTSVLFNLTEGLNCIHGGRNGIVRRRLIGPWAAGRLIPTTTPTSNSNETVSASGVGSVDPLTTANLFPGGSSGYYCSVLAHYQPSGAESGILPFFRIGVGQKRPKLLEIHVEADGNIYDGDGDGVTPPPGAQVQSQETHEITSEARPRPSSNGAVAGPGSKPSPQSEPLKPGQHVPDQPSPQSEPLKPGQHVPDQPPPATRQPSQPASSSPPTKPVSPGNPPPAQRPQISEQSPIDQPKQTQPANPNTGGAPDLAAQLHAALAITSSSPNGGGIPNEADHENGASERNPYVPMKEPASQAGSAAQNIAGDGNVGNSGSQGVSSPVGGKEAQGNSQKKGQGTSSPTEEVAPAFVGVLGNSGGGPAPSINPGTKGGSSGNQRPGLVKGVSSEGEAGGGGEDRGIPGVSHGSSLGQGEENRGGGRVSQGSPPGQGEGSGGEGGQTGRIGGDAPITITSKLPVVPMPLNGKNGITPQDVEGETGPFVISSLTTVISSDGRLVTKTLPKAVPINVPTNGAHAIRFTQPVFALSSLTTTFTSNGRLTTATIPEIVSLPTNSNGFVNLPTPTDSGPKLGLITSSFTTVITSNGALITKVLPTVIPELPEKLITSSFTTVISTNGHLTTEVLPTLVPASDAQPGFITSSYTTVISGTNGGLTSKVIPTLIPRPGWTTSSFTTVLTGTNGARITEVIPTLVPVSGYVTSSFTTVITGTDGALITEVLPTLVPASGLVTSYFTTVISTNGHLTTKILPTLVPGSKMNSGGSGIAVETGSPPASAPIPSFTGSDAPGVGTETPTSSPTIYPSNAATRTGVGLFNWNLDALWKVWIWTMLLAMVGGWLAL